MTHACTIEVPREPLRRKVLLEGLPEDAPGEPIYQFARDPLPKELPLIARACLERMTPEQARELLAEKRDGIEYAAETNRELAQGLTAARDRIAELEHQSTDDDRDDPREKSREQLARELDAARAEAAALREEGASRDARLRHIVRAVESAFRTSGMTLEPDTVLSEALRKVVADRDEARAQLAAREARPDWYDDVERRWAPLTRELVKRAEGGESVLAAGLRIIADRDSLRAQLDTIARALHPHWGDTTGNGYVPGQLAGMIRELRAQLAAEKEARAKAEARYATVCHALGMSDEMHGQGVVVAKGFV